MKPLKLKPLRRLAILSALVFLSLAGVPWKTGPLVHGVPLDIVNVSAPAINCKFAVACVIPVTDTTDHFVLAGSSGDAFLQSRTFSGEPGTVAAGLFGYEYRIDLTNLSGLTFNPCVTSFTIEFGPVVSLDYNDVPDGILDDVYVVTAGGLGTVAPSLADKVGDAITFRFDDPPVCAGQTTFFFGLASAHPPRFVTVQLKDLQAAVYNLQARAPALAAPTPLDHFKCYVTQGTAVGETVLLGDQFTNSTAKVGAPIRFCNPVEKIHGDRVTPIADVDAHLILYSITTGSISPTLAVSQPRGVVVRNQFGVHQLTLFKAVVLGVPTQKLEPTFHPPPTGLDHFKCYAARGESIDAVVGLRDEFHSEPFVQVLSPFLLCNPTVKVHNEVVTPILNPRDHLVCYRIRGGPFQGFAFTRNQFGHEDLTVGSADILCVPSEKASRPLNPNIQTMCGDSRPVVDFDGGNVPPNTFGGTGLYRDNPDATFPDGRPRRPCGEFAPIDGYLPNTPSVQWFRVAYRPDMTLRPAPGIASGVDTSWNTRAFWTGVDCPVIVPLSTVLMFGSNGWMSAQDYLNAKTGFGGIWLGCTNSGLRLAVWDTVALAGLGSDPNGRYIIWLEWSDGVTIFQEPMEHHIQLDNTSPVINDLVVKKDGQVVGPCGTATCGNMFEIWGEFDDDYFWEYVLAVFGSGTSLSKGPVPYYDANPNIDEHGTTPSPGTVHFDDVDMSLLAPDPPGFTDCCYALFLYVYDAAILHSFNHISANQEPYRYVTAFTTFSASPCPS